MCTCTHNVITSIRMMLQKQTAIYFFFVFAHQHNLNSKPWRQDVYAYYIKTFDKVKLVLVAVDDGNFHEQSLLKAS